MLPRNHPDRIRIAFHDHRLVANAGLILPATLALLPRPVPTAQRLNSTLDLGDAPGRSQHGRQDHDAGGIRPGWWRLH